MKSSYEETKKRSNYHFDKWIKDSGAIKDLGHISGNWQNEINNVIDKAKPLNWGNRRLSTNRPNDDVEAEENDLIQAGADPKMTIYRGLTDFNECPSIQKIVDFFALNPVKAKLHTQFTGEMLQLHIDKLYDLDNDPNNVIRIMVMMQDWEPGQFIMYGNQIHERWKSGDVHTFDWQNLPHATANASLTPRPMLVITGVLSETTRKILENPINLSL
jgi:hypothetical protein